MLENLDFNLYFSLFFLTILGFGTLVGFIRGYKKATYHFIVMVIFYVVFFLTINVVVNFLWHLNLPWLGSVLSQIMPELSNASSLKEAVERLVDLSLKGQLGEIGSNEDLQLFIQSFSILIFKIVYTILYFTIIEILYKLIALIIRFIVLRPKKDKNKEIPKRRGIGAGIGLLTGTMNLTVMLIILGGFMGIMTSAFNLLPENNDLENVNYVLDSYNDNIVISSIEEVNHFRINHMIFDYAYSFEFQNHHISIRKELELTENIYGIYQNSKYLETNNLSDITGDEIRKVFKEVSESDLLPAALPVGVEIAANYLDLEMTLTKEELYEIDWETEALQLGEIAAVTFDLLNSSGLIGENTVDYEVVSFNGEDISSLFDSISESEIINVSAYMALEPILERAGKDVQAFITLPKDIVYEDEFKAIGSVIGEVANTGITIGDIKSGDPAKILSYVSSVDLTIIENSKILSYAIINLVSGKTNLDGFEVFTVPADTVWFDVYNTNGEVIQYGELNYFLQSVNEIVKLAQDLDFNDINVDILTDLTDESVETLFNSEVMVATFSNQVEDIDLGTNSIVFPDQIYDENDYMTKDELKALIKSARIVFDIISCDSGVCEETFDLTKALNLSDTEIDTLLSSEIVAATVGDLISDEGKDSLTIPFSAYETIRVKSMPKQVVSKEEIKSVFKALSVLGFDDIENLDFNASIIRNLALDENQTKLDQTKANKIFDSEIIHATVSNMIIESADDTILNVPMISSTNEAITYYRDGITLIDEDELNQLLEAVLVLDIDDFKEIDTINIDLIIDNTNTLLESAIIHATFSEQLIKLHSPDVYIPMTNVNEEVVTKYVHSDSGYFGSWYIDKTELIHFFDALKLVGMDEINSFNGNFDLSTFYDEVNRNILLDSAIMHASISRQMLDLGDSILVVPLQDDEQNEVIKYVGDIYGSDMFVTKAEIHALVEALELLDISNIDDFSGTVELSNFYDDMNQEILLNSASMHATITKQMFDLGSDTLVIPNQDIDGNGIISPSFINKSEIKATINALEVLQINDIKSFEGAFNLSYLNNDENQTILLSSASIHATISKELMDLEDSVLIVPKFKQLGESEIHQIQKQVTTTNYIVKDEIKSIINALNTMGYGDLDHFGSTIESDKFFMNKETLLISSSIQATLSYKMLNETNGKLIIPDMNRIHQTDVTYIELGEMNDILTALELLDLMKFSTMDFNPGNILNDENKVDFDTLLSSTSIQATISDVILEHALDETATVGAHSLIIPNYFRESILVNQLTEKQIEKVELKDLLDSLDVLNVSTFDGAMNASVITNMGNDDLELLLKSKSVHVTLDNMLKGNTYINHQIPELAQVDLYQLTDLTTDIEIKAFIKASKEIMTEGEDFTNITFNLQTLKTLDENGKNVVLESMIVRNILTDQIEAILAQYPVYTIENDDYEESNPNYFFTSEAIIEIFGVLEENHLV